MSKQDRYAIGEGYGGTRASLGQGAPTIEWEWVHTGADFAKTHRLGKLNFGIWMVVALCAVRPAATSYLIVSGQLPLWSLLFAAVDIVTVCALLQKNRAAYPLVWYALITSFPLSLPLMFYWADGVRPNLIYRHRFERLVQATEAQNV